MGLEEGGGFSVGGLKGWRKKKTTSNEMDGTGAGRQGVEDLFREKREGGTSKGTEEGRAR